MARDDDDQHSTIRPAYILFQHLFSLFLLLRGERGLGNHSYRVLFKVLMRKWVVIDNCHCPIVYFSYHLVIRTKFTAVKVGEVWGPMRLVLWPSSESIESMLGGLIV